MIWKRYGPFRFYSKSNGDELETLLPVEDWGLHVVDVQYSIKVTAVSGTAAQIGLRHKDAPDPEPSTQLRLHSTPIALAAPPSTLPATMNGSTGTSPLPMPYFQPHVFVKQSGTPDTLQWVEAFVFMGGKPF